MLRLQTEKCVINHIQRYPNRWFARRGVAVVYLALVMIVLIGVLGLAIDTGYVFLTAHQLQNAADSAALAGANEVPFSTSQAITDAVAEASKNNAAQTAVTLTAANDVFVGNYDRTTSIFKANTGPINACEVIARRTTGSANGPLNLLFAPIFGITTAEVSRKAIAMNRQLTAAILLLSPSASPALMLTGSGSTKDKIVVANGTVFVNSNSSTAVQWTGNPYITATELDIVGNDTAVASGGVFPTGSLGLNSSVAADPLSSLAAPTRGPQQIQPPNGGTFQPGYYPNGITVGGTLSPGIYYVDNGISLKGSDAPLTGTGVMIYLASGGISLKGGSTIDISAPTTGAYAGMSYFEARTNSSPVELRGGSGQTDSGTLYFPAGDVTLQGTPNSYGTQLIANTLTIAGDGQIVYDGRNPIGRSRAFLVQ
jgi:Flp pilus assembly protein TadG